VAALSRAGFRALRGRRLAHLVAPRDTPRAARASASRARLPAPRARRMVAPSPRAVRLWGDGAGGRMRARDPGRAKRPLAPMRYHRGLDGGMVVARPHARAPRHGAQLTMRHRRTTTGRKRRMEISAYPPEPR